MVYKGKFNSLAAINIDN